MALFGPDSYEHLVRWQDGVVARRQLLEAGASAADVRRLLRRRDLTAVHPGTYVDHTGPLTPAQRAWAAVLHFWPAALCDESALPHLPVAGPVRVAVATERSVSAVAGVEVRRMAHLTERLEPRSWPPRVRVEHAVLDVAERRSDVAALFMLFADVCQTRRTTPSRIAAAVEERLLVPRRALFLELLGDLGSGACSVLEREYLRLERVHGLPRGDRQRRESLRGRTYLRDVPYLPYRIGVELDGRAFHDNAAARDRDLERDLDTIADLDTLTVRLGYAQVFTRGCATIAKIAALLQQRGWPGPFVRCPDCG